MLAAVSPCRTALEPITRVRESYTRGPHVSGSRAPKPSTTLPLVGSIQAGHYFSYLPSLTRTGIDELGSSFKEEADDEVIVVALLGIPAQFGSGFLVHSSVAIGALRRLFI
jgi:hypothetical protein